MTLSPQAVTTARRNVGQRIERFLNALDRAHRGGPNRRELFYLREALKKLEAGQYPEGEESMLNAERQSAVPEPAANDLTTNDRVTVVDLRAQLDSILKEAR